MGGRISKRNIILYPCPEILQKTNPCFAYFVSILLGISTKSYIMTVYMVLTWQKDLEY